MPSHLQTPQEIAPNTPSFIKMLTGSPPGTALKGVVIQNPHVPFSWSPHLAFIGPYGSVLFVADHEMGLPRKAKKECPGDPGEESPEEPGRGF